MPQVDLFDGVKTLNVVSVSGGKDSTATALLAIERNTENLMFLFGKDTAVKFWLGQNYRNCTVLKSHMTIIQMLLQLESICLATLRP